MEYDGIFHALHIILIHMDISAFRHDSNGSVHISKKKVAVKKTLKVDHYICIEII